MRKQPFEPTPSELAWARNITTYWRENPDALKAFQRAVYGDRLYERLTTPPPPQVSQEDHDAYLESASGWLLLCRDTLPTHEKPEAADLLAQVESRYAPQVDLLIASRPGVLQEICYERLARAEAKFAGLLDALNFPQPPTQPTAR